MAALKLTLVCSLIVAVVQLGGRTFAIAWVLVRDEFRGKRIISAIIDLPFALPDHRGRPHSVEPLRPQ